MLPADNHGKERATGGDDRELARCRPCLADREVELPVLETEAFDDSALVEDPPEAGPALQATVRDLATDLVQFTRGRFRELVPILPAVFGKLAAGAFSGKVRVRQLEQVTFVEEVRLRRDPCRRRTCRLFSLRRRRLRPANGARPFATTDVPISA